MDLTKLLEKLGETYQRISDIKTEIEVRGSNIDQTNPEVFFNAMSGLHNQIALLEGKIEVYEDWKKELLKQGVLVDQPERLLLRVPKKGIMHMLDDADKKPVDSLVRYLDSFGISAYVCGSVLQRHLTNNPTTYSDIDLVGVLNGNSNDEITSDMLLNLSHGGSPIERGALKGVVTKKDINRNPISTEPFILYSTNGRLIEINGSQFEVYNHLSEQIKYMRMVSFVPVNPKSDGVIGVYSFKPVADRESADKTQPSKIDLVLMTQNLADRQYRRE